MKKILPHVMVILFAVFGLAIIAMLMVYSFSALGKLFPGNFLGQVMGMVLFDVAALIWLGTIIYLCKSVGQYAIATLGFGLGLIGTLLLVAVEVMMGGQELAQVPSWAGDSIVWTFIVALVGHVILYYAFKLSAPEISAEISLGYETAQITDEAMKQATEQLIRERGMLGNMIAPRMITDVKRSLGLPVAGDILELTAENVYETPQPAAQFGQPQFVPQNYVPQTATSRKRKDGLDIMRRIQAAREAFSNPWKYAAAPAAQNAPASQPSPAPQSAPATPVAPAQPAVTPAQQPITPAAPASPVVDPAPPVTIPLVIPQQPATADPDSEPAPAPGWQPPFVIPPRKSGDPTNEEPTVSPS
ncbi:MAG: hypothetical protein J0M11_19880 [Anaerolineae bacterium]|nr:hypothetical protein [Anaerolineae bacterium]